MRINSSCRDKGFVRQNVASTLGLVRSFNENSRVKNAEGEKAHVVCIESNVFCIRFVLTWQLNFERLWDE